MGHTETYTRLHAALVSEAREHRLVPATVRAVVAVHERGGEATTLEIEKDLGMDGSAIRREVPAIRLRGLAKVTGIDGGPTRRGVRSLIVLTETGRAMAERVIEKAAA